MSLGDMKSSIKSGVGPDPGAQSVSSNGLQMGVIETRGCFERIWWKRGGEIVKGYEIGRSLFKIGNLVFYLN
jgi:hypothetical protein